MDVVIVRHAYLPVATLGSWSFPTVPAERFPTIELPWVTNPDGVGGMPRASCIPDGTYALRPWESPKFGPVYLFSSAKNGVYPTEADIPPGQKWGRCLVLLHPANQTSELLGCIAAGLRAGILDGKHWVYESRKAFDRISALLGRTGMHSVTIRSTAGTVER